MAGAPSSIGAPPSGAVKQIVGAGPTVSTPPRECLPKVWRSQSEPAQPAGRYETGPGRGAGVPVALTEESTEMLVSAPPETFRHRSTESRWPATALLSARELPEPSPGRRRRNTGMAA